MSYADKQALSKGAGLSAADLKAYKQGIKNIAKATATPKRAGK